MGKVEAENIRMPTVWRVTEKRKEAKYFDGVQAIQLDKSLIDIFFGRVTYECSCAVKLKSEHGITSQKRLCCYPAVSHEFNALPDVVDIVKKDAKDRLTRALESYSSNGAVIDGVKYYPVAI